MASAPPAPNDPNSLPSFIPKEHYKAARICCSIFEQELVPDMCHGHERADPKLTSSERARITNAFFLAWRIILDMQSNGLQIGQEHVNGLSPIYILHVREVAKFMFNNVEVTQHHEIERLMGYTASRDVVEKWLHLFTATGACFEEKSGYIHQPDYAPLGLGLLFDDWQESYVDTQVKEYLKLPR